jgi:hypothetical protein
MNRFRVHFSMSDRITMQFIRHNHPGFIPVAAQQLHNETLGSCTIPLGLQIEICDLTIPVLGLPKIVLLAIDLYKTRIDKEVSQYPWCFRFNLRL